jgi:hypothetical protein
MQQYEPAVTPIVEKMNAKRRDMEKTCFTCGSKVKQFLTKAINISFQMATWRNRYLKILLPHDHFFKNIIFILLYPQPSLPKGTGML